MAVQTNNTPDLMAYFEDNSSKAVDFLRWLVEQESMSRVPAATTPLAENFGQRLADLGGHIELIRHPKAGASLLARFDSVAGSSQTKQLLILGHLDTVWPVGTLASRPFRIEDGRAYGPGAFDMKAGLTIATFAVHALKELGLEAARPLTFLFTADEETGSFYSRDVIDQESRKSHAALVLEPPIPGGKVKTARKGVGEFELITRGRSAHAGNDPKAGISAITEMAHQILAINQIGNYERGTTLNVGVVSGGVLSNVIPAEARARIDMRYRAPEEGDRVTEAFSRLQPVLEGASLEVHGGINRPPLVRTPEIGQLFQHAKGLAAELGFQLDEGSVGGASDGNLVAALGVPVLDGLGVDGAGAHAEHEHIIINDIPRSAALLTRLIETI
jgi:glutamate carboxypeptidase